MAVSICICWENSFIIDHRLAKSVKRDENIDSYKILSGKEAMFVKRKKRKSSNTFRPTCWLVYCISQLALSHLESEISIHPNR